MRHGASREKIQTIAALPQLIQNGIYLEPVPTHAPKQKGMTSHVFAAKVNIDGKQMVAGFIIKEDMNGRRFYDHEMTEMKSLSEIVPKFGASSSVDESRQSESHRGLISYIVCKHIAVKPDLSFVRAVSAFAMSHALSRYAHI
jgi:hypothetical protein